MNKYGVQAMKMWQELAPSALAAMEEPNRHFSTLGEQALEQVTDLTIELTGPDVVGETYFEKVGRIENARWRAEEIVREELLIPPEELWETTEDETDEYSLVRQVEENLAEFYQAQWALREALDEAPPASSVQGSGAPPDERES